MINRIEELKKMMAELPKLGLAVVFAALSAAEKTAVEQVWGLSMHIARHWQPAMAIYGIRQLPITFEDIDILVYLGESSRFETVAGEISKNVPVVFVKSTIESLLDRPAGTSRRYRMSTGVNGIANELANQAPKAPTINWQTLPWPDSVKAHTLLEEAELRYVQSSIDAFRTKAEGKGIQWQDDMPANGEEFSVFLTMHDPAASSLAQTALTLWPQCTVLTADGMVATRSPNGTPWPERMVRVRHWVSDIETESNQLYSEAINGEPLPDFDSAGMTFGTLLFIEKALAAGAKLDTLDQISPQPGPLGDMKMSQSGRSIPERLVVLRGEKKEIAIID